MELLIAFLWIFLAVMVGLWTNRRGRSGVLATILSILISPALMWILHLAIGPKEVKVESNSYDGPIPSGFDLSSHESRS